MNEPAQKTHIKVAIAIMAVAIIASLVGGILAYVIEIRTESNQAFRHLEQLALSIENASAAAAYVDNEELAQEIVDGLAVIDIVAGAHLASATGMSILSSDFIYQDRSITLPLTAPFYDEAIGTLQIFADENLILKTAEQEAKQAAIALIFFSMMLAGFVSWLVFYMLSNPLRKLSASFLSIDPSAPEPLEMLKNHDRDEIGAVVTGINGLMSAIDFHKERERHLRIETEKLEKQFRLIFERASAGIAILDNTDSVITQNPSFLQLLQADTTELDSFPRLFLNEGEIVARLEHIRNNQHIENDTVDLKRKLDNGQIIWLHALISRVVDQRANMRKDDGSVLEIIFYDITNRMEQEKQIRFEADHDALTDLNNRRSGERKLTDMIEKCKSSDRQLIYFMIDLDKFKPVNDNHGHEAGDVVLVEVARRMKTLFSKSNDLCIRWGGDEFAVATIARNASYQDIEEMAANLLSSICEPIKINDKLSCTVEASIGIVIAPEHGANLDELMNNADHMMYYVKAHGRNSYRIYNP